MPKGTYFGALLLPVGDLCASSCEAATKKQLPAFFEMQLWAPRVAAKLAGCRDSTGRGGEVIKEELGFNWQEPRSGDWEGIPHVPAAEAGRSHFSKRLW